MTMSQPLNPENNHERFQARLTASHTAVFHVARWLWSAGNIVELRPSTTAPTHEESMQHIDSGDLWYLNPRKQPAEKKLVEVKGSGKDFTCAEDFPFDDMTVCNKPSFERIAPVKPALYVVLNRARTHAGLIDVGNTFLHWTERSQQDPHYPGHNEVVYQCPKDMVSFREVKY